MSQPLGDPALCRGHALRDFMRVDLQISPVKLLLAGAARCVFQCFVPVEACFCRDVSANSASAFMWSLCFTGHLRFAVRQFCELDTSTCVTSAFWLSCTLCSCDSCVVAAGRPSKTGGFLMFMWCSCRNVVSWPWLMCPKPRTVVYFVFPRGRGN